MKLAERHCDVVGCGRLADGTPSAHFARVVWFCLGHSAQFHAAGGVAELLHGPGATALSTREVLAWISTWLRSPAARFDQVVVAAPRLQPRA